MGQLYYLVKEGRKDRSSIYSFAGADSASGRLHARQTFACAVLPVAAPRRAMPLSLAIKRPRHASGAHPGLAGCLWPPCGAACICNVLNNNGASWFMRLWLTTKQG